MKFKYKKLAPGLIRPIIPVTLVHKDKEISYEALVDSGADMCVFPAQIGELLGLAVRSGREGPLRGVIGKEGKVYYHEIILDIGGNRTKANVGFSYDQTAQHGFLGQVGTFNIYSVLFQYRKETIEFKPEIQVD